MTDRILVLSPHPDDEAIGCGGTLRKHADEGAEITVVYLTSGDKGGHGMSRAEAMSVREAEALRACSILGIGNVHFWRGGDGSLRASSMRTAALAELMDQLAPAQVLVPHVRDTHPDHRACARLAQRAALVSNPKAEILMYEVWTPVPAIDLVVDITGTLQAKLRAIRAYRSQCSVLRFDDAFRGLARYRGEMFAWPKGEGQDAGKFAEVFQRLPVMRR